MCHEIFEQNSMTSEILFTDVMQDFASLAGVLSEIQDHKTLILITLTRQSRSCVVVDSRYSVTLRYRLFIRDRNSAQAAPSERRRLGGPKLLRATSSEFCFRVGFDFVPSTPPHQQRGRHQQLLWLRELCIGFVMK